MTSVSKNDSKLKVGRIEVDKVRQTVKVFAPSGDLVAFFPTTVGSEEKPTPSGALKVVSADANPNYRYNPDYKFKGVKSKQTFTIKPGPNNPAGSYWIGSRRKGIASMARQTRPRLANPNLMGAFDLPIGMSAYWAKALKKERRWNLSRPRIRIERARSFAR